jgi:hypothetical protein
VSFPPKASDVNMVKIYIRHRGAKVLRLLLGHSFEGGKCILHTGKYIYTFTNNKNNINGRGERKIIME